VGAHLPSLGRLPVGGYMTSCDARLVQSQTLPSQRRALPLSLDEYLFPFPLRVGADRGSPGKTAAEQ